MLIVKQIAALLLLPFLVAAAAGLTVPAGTPISITLTQPVWMNTAQIGDSLNGEVNFPVVIDGQIAIPPGTKVQGSLDIINRPARLTPRAEVRAHFTQLVFANGDVEDLSSADDEHAASVATFSVAVTRANDLLLDNGAQLTFTLGRAIRLNAPTQSVPFQAVATWKSASRCEPIPGTPGTPPTVIHGSAPTPPTVIPQGPGQPDIVIPGSPGTPDTVIGGTDATPDIPCPGPPFITTDIAQYTETFKASKPFAIEGVTFPKGSYRVSWTGLGPFAQVTLQGAKTTPHFFGAYLRGTPEQANATHSTLGPPVMGVLPLKSLQFKGQAFALEFNSNH